MRASRTAPNKRLRERSQPVEAHRLVLELLDRDVDVRRALRRRAVAVAVDVHVPVGDLGQRVVRPDERRVPRAHHHRPRVVEPLRSQLPEPGQVVVPDDQVLVPSPASPHPLPRRFAHCLAHRDVLEHLLPNPVVPKLSVDEVGDERLPSPASPTFNQWQQHHVEDAERRADVDATVYGLVRFPSSAQTGAPDSALLGGGMSRRSKGRTRAALSGARPCCLGPGAVARQAGSPRSGRLRAQARARRAR